MIRCADFIARHRRSPAAFTRVRKLPFAVVIVLLMQKSVKSIQVRLNEFCSRLQTFSATAIGTVTASAFTQARAKLAYTAFIELNEQAVLKTLYGDGDFLRYDGRRLVAIDGSKLRLPDTEEIRQEFGTTKYVGTDAHGHRHEHEHPMAVLSVLYDLLNEVGLEAHLAPGKTDEALLAKRHLEVLEAGDLLLADRHYARYDLLALLVAKHPACDFVIRCSAASFAPARQMLRGEGPQSQGIELVCPKHKRKQIVALGLPLSIPVRFVRVELDTGELEVLVTSLADEAATPSLSFKALYRRRWGVETYYDRLKDHLALEHFTGETVEAIKQDVHASVFLANVDAVLTTPTNQDLGRKEGVQHRQRVNKQVSYNAIKDQALALFLSTMEPHLIVARLEELFRQAPVVERPGRRYPRVRRSAGKRLHYQRHRRRHCF